MFVKIYNFLNSNYTIMMAIATIVIAVFAYLTWRLNNWRQKQYKNPSPEIYFEESYQILAKSKNRILITFLAYFVNTGLSPIIGEGIEHRIKNLETKENYKFGETRFTGQYDKHFGGLTETIQKFPPAFSDNKTMLVNNVEIFPPYPLQDLKELWRPGETIIDKEYIINYPWIISPHKFRWIRWYAVLPYKANHYYPFRIGLILHYRYGGKQNSISKNKDVKIKPLTIGDGICFYETF